MDAWESFFRQKSERRSKGRRHRRIAIWAVAAVGLLILIMGLIAAMNAALDQLLS